MVRLNRILYFTLFLSIIKTLSAFSQSNPKAFLDINTSLHANDFGDFFIYQDSIAYVVVRDAKKTNSNNIEIHRLIKDSIDLVCTLNSGKISFYEAGNKLFFLHQIGNNYNKDLYSIKDDHVNFITNLESGIISGPKLTLNGYFVYPEYYQDSFRLIKIEENHTDTIPINFSLNPIPNINFLENIDDKLYFTIGSYESDSLNLFSFNTSDNSIIELGKITNELYESNSVDDFLLLHNFKRLLKIDYNFGITYDSLFLSNTDQNKFVLNKHLYFTYGSLDPEEFDGIYRFNTNSLEVQKINDNPISTSLYQRVGENMIYFQGYDRVARKTNYYTSDSLFQEYTVVPPLPLPFIFHQVTSSFIFKGELFEVQKYARERSYDDYYSRIIKYNFQTQEVTIVIDSFEDSLHLSDAESVIFSEPILFENHFYITQSVDRQFWRVWGLKKTLWKSDGSRSQTKPIKTFSSRTESAGIYGLNSNKNDLFFFAQKEDGFHLQITDASRKNTKDFVDSTFTKFGSPETESKLYKLDNRIFYICHNTSSFSTHNPVLACTDGSKKGTQFVTGNVGNISEPEKFQIHEDYLYFIDKYKRLFRTKNSQAEQLNQNGLVYEYFISENHIYFNQNTTFYSINLTTNVKEERRISLNDSAIFIKTIGLVNNKLLFTVSEDRKIKLFTLSHGENNPRFIKEIPQHPYVYTNFKEHFYFTTSDGNAGLWKTDGTTLGTNKIYSNFLSSSIVACDDFLIFPSVNFQYFISYDGTEFNHLDIMHEPYYHIGNVQWESFPLGDHIIYNRNKHSYITYGKKENTSLYNKEPVYNVTSVGNKSFFSSYSEDYGNELWVDQSCKQNLNLTSVEENTNLYSAQGLINSSQNILTSDVIYRAGKSISLQPGFKTEDNIYFKAEIEDCDN
ncbi:3-coathanger stack domain-containing protein [Arcticibacterium luteifluviistationis]|uniref:DUF5050 domain-containing protein n=1 Tax=Arcticibacterium luteifluviistationis TaxID=1784714 RepID=A0A2Z4GH98_9BACT|nr:3-coathanger stack domain-containing protein [Arcticibacterium luteifluviistationis]AWW00299.1 hypothetical protein DJ013_19825 [Arcticibacterium luteifluviistationis]